MTALLRHRVSVFVNERQLENWLSYEIVNDMLEPADAFRLAIPFSKGLWDRVAPDALVDVYIDDTRVLRGFIDTRTKNSAKGSGSVIEIDGRDKGGRLVDESMPLVRFANLTIQELAERACGIDPKAPTEPRWFDRVALSNARNRALVRGGGAKAKAPKEPPIDSGRNIAKKVNPGETRWQALAYFLQEAQLLAWSSADGKEFIVGRPNYDQERQYSFFHAAHGSLRYAEVNVLSLAIQDSTAERYSLITACGTGKGNSTNYGSNVLNRRATVKNNQATIWGEGKDFTAPKRLLVPSSDLRTGEDAKKCVVRVAAERDATAHEVSITAAGHGQIVRGREPTLFAFDTIAHVEDEEVGLSADYLVTRVQFTGDREGGERTELRLVSKGTELRI